MYEVQGMKQSEPWEIRITSADGRTVPGAEQEELWSAEECRGRGQVQNYDGTSVLIC